MMAQYLFNIFRAFDQFCNALLAGDPRETMSSRLGKAAVGRCVFCRWVCRLLSLVDKRHCETSVDMTVGSMGVEKD